MDKPIRILILEDVSTDAELMVHELEKSGLKFITKLIDTEKALRVELDAFAPNLILSDYSMPQFTGLDALQIVLEECPETPFIIVTGSLTEETAVECIKAGAWDYVIKEHLTRLVPSVKEVLELKRAREERKQAVEEKAQIETQLRQAQKLESIATLTSGLAHDFNNILGAIFGSVDRILMQLPNDHPSRPYANIILDKSQRAADLVKSMMAYSRQQELNPKPLVINNAIENLSLLLDRAIEERIELELQLAHDLRPISGDSTAIDQIVMNLCVNAVDAMKTGGKLTVRTQNLENNDRYIDDFPEVKPGRYVLLSVIDTGHGIEPEDLEQIFEPFFTTKKVGEGTGLGLSMVFRLVKQHDGYIFCKSTVGKGTTFEMLLPVVDKLQTTIEDESSNVQLQHGVGTIMVVEDDKGIVEILEVMLIELGYDIITASDGEKALAIYRDVDKQIDLIISDIIMPNMGGKELYQELKTIDPKVKFIFISGYTDRGFYKKYNNDPNVKILNKPFRLKEVSAIVKEVLTNLV